MMGVAPLQNNGAKDAARNEEEGAPIKHTSPTKGNNHYHATDNNGQFSLLFFWATKHAIRSNFATVCL